MRRIVELGRRDLQRLNESGSFQLTRYEFEGLTGKTGMDLEPAREHATQYLLHAEGAARKVLLLHTLIFGVGTFAVLFLTIVLLSFIITK